MFNLSCGVMKKVGFAWRCGTRTICPLHTIASRLPWRLGLNSTTHHMCNSCNYGNRIIEPSIYSVFCENPVKDIHYRTENLKRTSGGGNDSGSIFEQNEQYNENMGC